MCSMHVEYSLDSCTPCSQAKESEPACVEVRERKILFPRKIFTSVFVCARRILRRRAVVGFGMKYMVVSVQFEI